MKMTILGTQTIQSFSNKKTVVLLFHGYSSSPDELRPLAKKLKKHAIDVYAPLLPGHGSHPKDLLSVDKKVLFQASEKAYQFLKKKYASIYVGGVCLGGNLAIHLAAQHPDIKGILLFGCPLYYRYHLLAKPLAFLVSFFPGYYYKAGRDKQSRASIKEGKNYRKFPLRGFKTLITISDQSKQDIKKIRQKLLIMQSKKDYVVHPRSANSFLEHSKNPHTKMFLYDKAGHALIRHDHNGDIFDEVVSFVEVNS